MKKENLKKENTKKGNKSNEEKFLDFKFLVFYHSMIEVLKLTGCPGGALGIIDKCLNLVHKEVDEKFPSIDDAFSNGEEEYGNVVNEIVNKVFAKFIFE